MRLKISNLGAAMLAVALAGCSSESGSGPTAEEERQLNEAAAMLEDNVFDTSADSLVADEAALENGEATQTDTPSNAQ